MTDIGILGLDTSHGEAFAEVLRQLEPKDDVPEPTVAAVWDDGTIRGDEYVARFCDEFGATRYDDPAEMVSAIDATLVLTVDWERHVPLATPFLEADVPTLVDKPIAGSAAELETLEEAASNTPLFGGSALPYHPSFAALSDATGRRTLHLAGYNDYFYYRVHIVDAVRRLANASWTSVRPVENAPTSGVEVAFDDGTWATLRFDGSTDDAVFGVLDVADRTRAATVESSKTALREMYRPYLETFLEVVRGVVDPPTDSVIDAARLLLAVEVALSTGETVAPGDDSLETVEISSEQFLATYEPYY